MPVLKRLKLTLYPVLLKITHACSFACSCKIVFLPQSGNWGTGARGLWILQSSRVVSWRKAWGIGQGLATRSLCVIRDMLETQGLKGPWSSTEPQMVRMIGFKIPSSLQLSSAPTQTQESGKQTAMTMQDKGNTGAETYNSRKGIKGKTTQHQSTWETGTRLQGQTATQETGSHNCDQQGSIAQ